MFISRCEWQGRTAIDPQRWSATMPQSILVPLDGSSLSEQALGVAISVAERKQTPIELVHVYDSLPPYLTQNAPVIDPALDIDRRHERAEYLRSVVHRLGGTTSVPITATLLDGPVARTLAGYIASRGVDLVVMTTHGRSGLGRALLGSVAAEVVRHSPAPVLLVKPDATSERAAAMQPFQRVLIPLDGSAFAEGAIDAAIATAGREGVSYTLLQAVPPPSRGPHLPESASERDQENRDERAAAERYLDALVDGLRARGVHADAWALVDEHVVRAILDYAARIQADLIALATHGRGGVRRVLLGSVAERVVNESTIPVLVYRPRPAQASPTADAQEAAGSRTTP